MAAFIEPPPRYPWVLRLGLWYARRVAGVDLLIGRLLAWYPRAAVSSGLLEALIAQGEGRLDERLLTLVRLQVSYAAACPFCIAMNGRDPGRFGITAEEIAALRGARTLDEVATFSPLERVALGYARLITQTPLKFPPDFIATLKQHFSEREIVILATTAAQVNYWTRLIQALGLLPAG
jgi:AhpD family alkylhydroperoxidase